MIPKKIHYCWFGGAEKPAVLEKCLKSWQLHCPGFEIIEWNENTSSRFSNPFYRNALRKKAYAFVADYVRSAVLLEQGGVYLDTDMLLIKPIDVLLKLNFFTGEEVDGRVAYGLFGAVKGHRFLNEMVRFYEKNHFNQFSLPVITHQFSPLINKTTLEDNEQILDQEYFYPLSYEDKEKDYERFVTPNTFAVHLWDHSWKPEIKESFSSLFKKLTIVISDVLFYGYPTSYAKRYLKEFSRKLVRKII